MAQTEILKPDGLSYTTNYGYVGGCGAQSTALNQNLDTCYVVASYGAFDVVDQYSIPKLGAPTNSTIDSVIVLGSGRQEYVTGDYTFYLTCTVAPGRVTTSSFGVSNSDGSFVDGGYNVTSLRPGGGSWIVSDFTSVSPFVHLGFNWSSGYTPHAKKLWLQIGFTLPTPTATTTSASGLTPTTAILNGTINPNTANTTYPVSYKFEYGLTDSYGTVTTPVGNQTGSSDLPASTSISGLTANTTYHYRVVAYNGDVTTNGSDQTFVTSGLDPTLGVF